MGGSKRKDKEEEKFSQKEFKQRYQLAELEVQQRLKQKPTPSNIEHFESIKASALDKVQQQKFRDSISPSSQINDFEFISNAQILTINRNGVLQSRDFFSGVIETSHQIKASQYSDVVYDREGRIHQVQENKLIRVSPKLYFIQSPHSISLYDQELLESKTVMQSQITDFLCLQLEGLSLDFDSLMYLNELQGEELGGKGGFLVGTSTSGVLRYQMSRSSQDCNI